MVFSCRFNAAISLIALAIQLIFAAAAADAAYASDFARAADRAVSPDCASAVRAMAGRVSLESAVLAKLASGEAEPAGVEEIGEAHASGAATGGAVAGAGLAMTKIEDSETPMYGPAELGMWAIANLAIAIAGMIATMFTLVTIMARRYGRHMSPLGGARLRVSMFGAATGIGLPLIFMVTEDIHNSVGAFDNYTWIMAAIFVVQCVCIMIGLKPSGEKKAA
jgi:hypothetical protein